MKPPPRSVGRYRPGAALLGGVAGLVAIVGVLASSGNASPKAESQVATGTLRIGMNSCAVRGCHGAVDATEPGQGRVYIKEGAYTTWLQYDPHARAYAVLLEKRSIAIAEKLSGPLKNKPAHEAGLCLSCHSTVGPPEAMNPEVFPLSDGISCEACHGPAKGWRDEHLAAAWRGKDPSEKALDGLVDLSTPTARARSCVGCHVGDRLKGRDVNHDLIAAGHPRLNFEFATYQANYPKHWKETGDPAGFEAQSWAIGQVVTAQAVLDLLAARAFGSKEGASQKPPAPDAIWPEFSEYECFACHHDLTNPSLRQEPGRVLGRLPWQTWPSAMLPELIPGRPEVKLDAWTKLGDLMAGSEPDPVEVVKLANQAKAQLGDLRKSLEARPLDPAWIDARSKDLAGRKPAVGEGWDRLAQSYLALQAMARASKKIDPEVEEAIRKASASLEFPTNYDSPRDVSPPAKPDVPVRPVR